MRSELLLGMLVAGTVALASSLSLGSTGSAGQGPRGNGEPALVSAVQPFDAPLRDLTRGIYRGLRRTIRQVGWVISHAADVWGRWVARVLLFTALALLVGLVDRNLLAAWRREGLRVLGNYIPLMLYVYVRLFFDRRVRLVAKLVLAAAIVYGVQRADVLPDRSLMPGYVEDIVLLDVAMRFLIYCSPTAVVEAYAAQAVNLRRRLVAS
jgi:uncharacterized membrane protein YkvA (DUF1232 family)